MKPARIFINNSRGTVVDLDALAEALREGQSARRRGRRVPGRAALERGTIRVAAAGLENVILTPHIGGSTEEAQERIGAEVARKLIDYSDIGSTIGRGEFSAGATAAAPVRHALHPGAAQRAGHARAVERSASPATPSTSRRNITRPTARSVTWCWTPTHRPPTASACWRNPGAGRHDPRPAALRVQDVRAGHPPGHLSIRYCDSWIKYPVG